MTAKTTVYIDFIHDLGGGAYKLEGYLGGTLAELDDVSLRLGNATLPLKKVQRIQSQSSLELHRPIEGSTFETEFKLDGAVSGKLFALFKGRKIKIRTNQFTGLSNLLVSYKVIGDKVFLKKNGDIRIYPVSTLRLAWFEALTLLSVLTNWRIPAALQKIAFGKTPQGRLLRAVKGVGGVGEAIITIPASVFLRLAYFVRRSRVKKPIWIISDRVMAAGDNGEALFEYIQRQKDAPADVYFAISRRSPDYTRLISIGRVLDYGSFKHRLLFLLSDKIISSHADTEVINPFLRQIDRYVDLFNFDFVFLQHGIIRHDLSGWLNRFDKNIKLFITSSRVERQSILDKPYAYTEENVLLSGLPRFDNRKNEPKNKIILMPTFRKFLLRGGTNKSGERSYDPTFKNSSYFKFYGNFMNDKRVTTSLKERGITGEFYVHPVFRAQARDFEQNDYFSIMDYPYDYSRAFREGNLLISDYSSVAFEFAYLKKPQLYAQFDADRFYIGHTSEKSDFFDDKKDGFGPVCPDYESLVAELLKAIDNGFKMPEKFKKRAEDYFEYNDRRNSERVYYAILKLGTKSR